MPRVVPGPSGTRFAEVRWFDELDSTNRYLLSEARAGAGEGLVVVADHQSAGRGRLGRRWEAPPGANLLASVLLRPHLPFEARHLASAVVALAAADACAALGGVAASIKWPNDLLVDGRKLAGVLAEADVGTEGRAPIVVGIGINVAWPAATTVGGPTDPPAREPGGPGGPGGRSSHQGDRGPRIDERDLADSATSLLRETGRPVDRARLLDRLLVELEPRAAALSSAGGRIGQAAELRSRCTTIGTRVRVESSDSTFNGMAVDVTAEGHLVVDVDDQGPRTVVVGDVIHLRTAPDQGRGPG
ncbi:MAG TPA: biotin--[acetyl-CoA-carboxylase] ligase [Acidimicrobiales bacterium]